MFPRLVVCSCVRAWRSRKFDFNFIYLCGAYGVAALRKFRWPSTPKTKKEASDILDKLIEKAKESRRDKACNFGLGYSELMLALAEAIVVLYG